MPQAHLEVSPASAVGADVTGWLEVVFDDDATLTVPRLGKFTTRGDWFYLDNTTECKAPTVNGGKMENMYIVAKISQPTPVGH